MVVFRILALIAAANASSNLCSNFTPKILKILECVNVNRSMIKVISLSKSDIRNLIMEDFINDLTMNLKILEVPYVLRTYNLGFEYKVIDYSELFSWTGSKFDLRPLQVNLTKVIYDGLTKAHPLQTAEITSSSTILVAESFNVLDEYLTGSARPPFHSTRSLFNIIVMGEKDESEQVHDILGRMWRIYGIKVSVLFYTCDDDIVYFGDQYSLKPERTDLYNYSSWGILQKVFVEINLSLICDRTHENYPQKFNGFPLKVFLFEENPNSLSWEYFPKSFLKSKLGELRKYNPITAGYNGLTTAGLVEYLNFTPNYILPGDGASYAYKTPEGIVKGAGEVSYSKFDVVGMLHFIAGRQGMDYEFLQPIYFDRYCVIVPKAKRIPLYIAPAWVFKLSAWLVMFTIPWTSTFFWKVLNFIKPFKEKGLKNTQTSFIILLFYCVLMSVVSNIKTKAQTERWILSGCMAFSIIFMTIFNANFVSHITTDRRYKDIDTLKELADSRLSFVTSSPFMINIVFGDVSSSSDPVMNKLKQRMILGNDSIENVVLGKNCIALQKLDFDLLNRDVVTRYGEERLHLIDQCPSSYYTTFIVRRGWAYSSIFNMRIMNLVEFGFVELWKEFSKHALDLADNMENIKKGVKARSIIMTTSNTWVWFAAIYVCGFFGIIIFICEILWFRWKMRNKRKLFC